MSVMVTSTVPHPAIYFSQSNMPTLIAAFYYGVSVTINTVHINLIYCNAGVKNLWQFEFDVCAIYWPAWHVTMDGIYYVCVGMVQNTWQWYLEHEMDAILFHAKMLLLKITQIYMLQVFQSYLRIYVTSVFKVYFILNTMKTYSKLNAPALELPSCN